MKKLDMDVILKMLILLGFSIFYLVIILNNQILIYVHPRIVPFAIFGMISMFIIALFFIPDSINNRKRKIKLKNYVVFAIPLSLVFFMQSINANSSTATNKDKNSDITDNLDSAGSTYEIYSGKTESNGQGVVNKKQLYIRNNIIEVNQRNFVFSIDEIIDNIDKYEGKEIEITGFVYRNKELKENEFILGRFMMVCCAADMQIAGLRCDNNNLESYSNNTWVKVKGKIKKDTYDGAVDPIIVLEHIEKDNNPDTSYVYPF
ncbi:TIGR03943 family putative permease subunit [Clostridium saccharoperbutylacetonicum]